MKLSERTCLGVGLGRGCGYSGGVGGLRLVVVHYYRINTQ